MSICVHPELTIIIVDPFLKQNPTFTCDVFPKCLQKVRNTIHMKENDTLISQSPRSIILRGVRLYAVWYCAELISAQQYLKTFAEAFKGTLLKKNNKISMILRGVSFFDTKIRISQRKRHQKQKHFNPLFCGPGWFERWKNWRSKVSLDCHITTPLRSLPI